MNYSIFIRLACALAAQVASLALYTATTGAAASHATSCGSWRIVASPSPYHYENYLNAVAAVSTTDVWAVGSGLGTYGGNAEPLIEQWNGAAWNVVSSPTLPGGSGAFSGLAALTVNNIWAVGDDATGTLIEHWNGSAWQIVASPGIGTLNAVSASSASDICLL